MSGLIPVEVPCEDCLQKTSCSSYNSLTRVRSVVEGVELEIDSRLNFARLFAGICTVTKTFVTIDIGNLPADNSVENSTERKLPRPGVIGLRVAGVSTVSVSVEDLKTAPEVPVVISNMISEILD